MTTLQKNLGFIGAGNMAEAIIGALIKSESIKPDRIFACDISSERLDYMQSRFKIKTTDNINSVYKSSDVVILAVKPQSMAEVLKDLGADCPLKKRKLIISIAAGIKTSTFESVLYANLSDTEKENLPVIRVMPNTPSLVLSGMSGFCANKNTNRDDIASAQTILESMGKIVEVKETKMDAVTAISGSGPAYFLYFIESMVEEAQNLGLTKEEAELLSITTMKGTAELLEHSGESPAELRKKVTSPGGTTEAAIKVFDASKTKEIIKKAVSAAAKRSEALS